VTRPIPVPESEFTDAVRIARTGRHAQAIERIEFLTREGALPPARKAAAADALAHIARLASAAGDVAHAVAALEVALRFQSDYPDLHYRRARLLLQLQRRPEARRELERALALNPRYTAARLERALLDAAEGFIGEALDSLRALARETEIERPLVFEQGLESLERADWEEAGALLTGALALDEPADGSVLDRARALLEAGDVAQAARLLQAALPGREGWPDLHYLLGSAELQRGHFDDALSSLARAVELNPEFHAARLQFARALDGMGELAQAADQVALVLQRDPGHPQALELHERWTSPGRRSARSDRAREDA
jgi:thioredoxin-like negative regulator of GroEL